MRRAATIGRVSVLRSIAPLLPLLLLEGCAAIWPMSAPTFTTPRRPPVAGTPLFDWKGAIHCHSYLSHDSKGTIAEISAAAAAARFDFLVMTDHQTDRSIAEGVRGTVGDMLWVVGAEVRSNRGTILAFPLTAPLKRVFDHRALVAEAHAQGALVFHAHGELTKAWDLGDVDGVEIVNLHAGAIAAPHVDMILGALFLPVRNVMMMTARRIDDVFVHWDALLAVHQPQTPIGGNDAHANVRLFGPLGGTIGTYDEVFFTLSTHVLAERMDEPSLLEALKLGRTYVSCDLRGEGTGFDFRGVVGNLVILPGDTVAGVDGLELRVKTPLPGEIKLLRDGAVVQTTEGRDLVSAAPLPGVYRVEVTREGFPWLFSSTIKVTARP